MKGSAQLVSGGKRDFSENSVCTRGRVVRRVDPMNAGWEDSRIGGGCWAPFYQWEN